MTPVLFNMPFHYSLFYKVCFKVVTAHDRPQVPVDTTVIPAEEENEGCPRCGGKVNNYGKFSFIITQSPLNGICRN